mmetsp:Transcript_10826/g.49191  ORF Transcript_10826/g.49191 Transcript_10826/m.49191 type:complete len:286 (+) Transcript_10826:1676-2533(+)
MLSLTMSSVRNSLYIFLVLVHVRSSFSASARSRLCRALTSPAMPAAHFSPISINFSSSASSNFMPPTRASGSLSEDGSASESSGRMCGIFTLFGSGRRSSSSSELSGFNALGLRGIVFGASFALAFLSAAADWVSSVSAGLRFSFFFRPSSLSSLSFLSFLSFFSFFSFLAGGASFVAAGSSGAARFFFSAFAGFSSSSSISWMVTPPFLVFFGASSGSDSDSSLPDSKSSSSSSASKSSRTPKSSASSSESYSSSSSSESSSSSSPIWRSYASSISSSSMSGMK